MKPLNANLSKDLDTMIASDPRYQAAEEDCLEITEGYIDHDLENFGYPTQEKISELKLKELGLLDPVFNDKTGDLESNGISFYTKAGYHLADNANVIAQNVRQEIDQLDLNTEEGSRRFAKLTNMVSSYDGQIFAYMRDRIHYHISILEMALSQNSWKYEALFKGIGGLKSALSYKFFEPNFYLEDLHSYPQEYFYGLCIQTGAHIYQVAINRRLFPTEHADFAALTMEDLYSLSNYIVPPLIQMINIIASDLVLYLNLYTLNGGNTWSVHARSEFGKYMDKKGEEYYKGCEKIRNEKKELRKNKGDGISDYYDGYDAF